MHAKPLLKLVQDPTSNRSGHSCLTRADSKIVLAAKQRSKAPKSVFTSSETRLILYKDASEADRYRQPRSPSVAICA